MSNTGKKHILIVPRTFPLQKSSGTRLSVCKISAFRHQCLSFDRESFHFPFKYIWHHYLARDTRPFKKSELTVSNLLALNWQEALSLTYVKLLEQIIRWTFGVNKDRLLLSNVDSTQNTNLSPLRSLYELGHTQYRLGASNNLVQSFL